MKTKGRVARIKAFESPNIGLGAFHISVKRALYHNSKFVTNLYSDYTVIAENEKKALEQVVLEEELTTVVSDSLTIHVTQQELFTVTYLGQVYLTVSMEWKDDEVNFETP